MKINILFVDDEKDVIGGYKRMLFSMRNTWGQHFALSGDEALKIIEKNDIDVIITDMRMPNMDGAQLLKIVKEKYPGLLRIILSGHQGHDKIVQSITTAHQFLLKPCDTLQIKKTIEKAYSIRDRIENKELHKLVNSIGQLPSLPELYLELEQEIKKEDVSLKRVRDIVIKDPAVTVKILHMVNSGFFGLPRRVTDLLQALSLLGINTIKSIVLYLQTFSENNYPPNVKAFCNNLGKHSLMVGHLAKKLAELKIKDKSLLDDIFVAGILHDIGRLVMLEIPGYIETIKENYGEPINNLAQIEEEHFKVSHENIGAYLLGIWGLPTAIVEAAAFHHYPMDSSEDKETALTYIHIADAMVSHNGDTYMPPKLNVDGKYIKLLDLDSKLEYYWKETRKELEGKDE